MLTAVDTPQLEAFSELIASHPRLVVLTGAGISTVSGIPAYRDHTGRWLGSDPIQHGDFIAQPAMRQRYWARSAFGWGPVSRARPNTAHDALVSMEQAGWIELLVTQNVDRLHQKAGHRDVVDLHGRLDRVRCLSCSRQEDRDRFQSRLLSANKTLADALSRIKSSTKEVQLAPDGDAWPEDDLTPTIDPPPCPDCGGVMMPDVVFFGGAVPGERVAAVSSALERADALLVVGSSLMVYSGLRFCRLARQMGKPVIAINRGATRADDQFRLKWEADCGAALTALAGSLGAR